MASIYTDENISFHIPSGYKVRKLHEGNYSLYQKDFAINIALCRREELALHLWQMEAGCRYPVPWAVFSPVEEATFGQNECQYQQVTRRGSAGGKMTIVMHLPRGHALIGITGLQDYSIQDFRELLESLSAISGNVLTRPQETAADRRKWEGALRAAIESVRGRKDKKKHARVSRPKQVPSDSPIVRRSQRETKWLRRLKVFADHYQFCIYDVGHDPFTPFPAYGEEEMEQGWTGSKHAIWYFTSAHRNVHRVDIGIADNYVPDSTAERLMVHTLEVSSGKLAVYDYEEQSEVDLAPGAYTLYTRPYNLGKEESQSLDEEELLQRDDLERYEIVIVPGTVQGEGAVHGAHKGRSK